MTTYYYRRKFTPPAVTDQVIDHGILWAESATIAALTNLWINGNVLPLSGLDAGQTIAASLLNDAAENVLAMEVDADEVEFRIVLVYAPAPTATYVWVMRIDGSAAYLFHPDGSATGWALATAAIAGQGPIRQVGSEVWVLTWDTTTGIDRLNLDGSSAGARITGIVEGLALETIGSQVWVADSSPNLVKRYNFDGTSAGADLSGPTIGGPQQILVVGDKAWVVGFADYTSTQIPVNVFDFSGTLITSFDPAGGTNDWSQIYLGLVGSEIWGAQTGVAHGGYTDDPTTWPDGNVWRIDTSGGAIAHFTDPTIKIPLGVVYNGGDGWVVNHDGTVGSPETVVSTVSVYTTSGTPTAESPLIDPRHTRNFYNIATFGAYVWVSVTDNSFVLYDSADRSLKRILYTDYPVFGPSTSLIRAMTAVTMPPLPPVTTTNTTPSGGPSGDGVTTLGLVGEGATLTATVDVDLYTAPVSWNLLIVDESNNIIAYIDEGTTLSVGVWRTAGSGGVSHTYHALLSTTSNSLSGANPATTTNTVTITWP